MIEGYWYSRGEPTYPMPVPYVLTQEQADDLYALIKKKESRLVPKGYMGWSDSRIDGSRVGTEEFETDGWRWPKGFAEHYVKKYRVKPTSDFLKFIGYNDKK
jgi:hypothetical protein